MSDCTTWLHESAFEHEGIIDGNTTLYIGQQVYDSRHGQVHVVIEDLGDGIYRSRLA